MNKLLIFGLLFFILIGCTEEQKNYQTATDIKIVSKESEDFSAGRYMDRRYYINIEKNGNKIRMRISEQLYKDVSVGSMADIFYDDANIIKKVNYKIQ